MNSALVTLTLSWKCYHITFPILLCTCLWIITFLVNIYLQDHGHSIPCRYETLNLSIFCVHSIYLLWVIGRIRIKFNVYSSMKNRLFYINDNVPITTFLQVKNQHNSFMCLQYENRDVLFPGQISDLAKHITHYRQWFSPKQSFRKKLSEKIFYRVHK